MIGVEAESSSSVVLAAEVWWPSVDCGWGWGWGWATAVAFVFIFAWHYAGRFFFIFLFSRLGGSNANLTIPTANIPQLRVSEIVSEDDLKFLIDNLEENPNKTEKWELVTERRNSTVYYTAKCCKPKDGPLKYLSVTLFQNCSRELLGNFYMDNDYRKLWDKMLTVFEQLEVDRSNGTEIGRMIKKFPLLTAREYVLAWRLWEGSDASLYCFTKQLYPVSTPSIQILTYTVSQIRGTKKIRPLFQWS